MADCRKPLMELLAVTLLPLESVHESVGMYRLSELFGVGSMYPTSVLFQTVLEKKVVGSVFN